MAVDGYQGNFGIFKLIPFIVKMLITILVTFCCIQYRLSPFANTRARKVRRQGFGKILKFTNSSSSPSINRNTQRKWFSLIDSALSHKKKLLRVKKLKDSFLLNKDLHCPFYGFIVFEVEWIHVRGINYINELQV